MVTQNLVGAKPLFEGVAAKMGVRFWQSRNVRFGRWSKPYYKGAEILVSQRNPNYCLVDYGVKE